MTRIDTFDANFRAPEARPRPAKLSTPGTNPGGGHTLTRIKHTHTPPISRGPCLGHQSPDILPPRARGSLFVWPESVPPATGTHRRRIRRARTNTSRRSERKVNGSTRRKTRRFTGDFPVSFRFFSNATAKFDGDLTSRLTDTRTRATQMTGSSAERQGCQICRFLSTQNRQIVCRLLAD